MSGADQPHWYEPGDVPATIRNATENANVTVKDVVDVLATFELEAPRDRLQTMVDSARARVSTDTREAAVDLEESRPLEPRFIDVSDLRYLNATDFATVLGVTLSRYEGTFRVPEEVDELAVDLFWNRQHTTIGFALVTRPPSAPVEDPDVLSVRTGETSPPFGRAVSALGIVSLAGFTEAARKVAAENDIRLFGPEYLTRWLSDAQLTPDVFGTLISHDDLGDAEIDEICSQLPDVPKAVRETDPLGDCPETGWSGGGDIAPVPTDVKRPMPIPETLPDPGQKGTLYANPADDGDFGAFDRFMNELAEEDE
jgi:hypothetical protein